MPGFPGFSEVGYFYELVAGANLMHKKKLHFTLYNTVYPSRRPFTRGTGVETGARTPACSSTGQHAENIDKNLDIYAGYIPFALVSIPLSGVHAR